MTPKRTKSFDTDGRFLPRYRVFLVTEGDGEAEKRSGIGVTAEHVIEDWQDLFRYWHATNQDERERGCHDGVSDAELASGFNDAVVWDVSDGGRVVAVLRPDPTGKPELVVTRYDTPAPALPKPSMTLTERNARARLDPEIDDEMAGIDALDEIDEARRKARGVAWSVTEGEHLLYHCHHRMTLDRVLDQELSNYRPSDSYHRAVWHGERLLAVVRPGPDGRAEAVRLDDGRSGGQTE